METWFYAHCTDVTPPCGIVTGIDDPTIRLPRRHWLLLNRFRAGLGHCGTYRKSLADNVTAATSDNVRHCMHAKLKLRPVLGLLASVKTSFRQGGIIIRKNCYLCPVWCCELVELAHLVSLTECRKRQRNRDSFLCSLHVQLLSFISRMTGCQNRLRNDLLFVRRDGKVYLLAAICLPFWQMGHRRLRHSEQRQRR